MNGVLYISTEEDPSRVLRQRLEAVGADLQRVHFLRTMIRGTAERAFSLPRDLDQLRTLILEKEIGLVIFDPLVGIVDEDLNVNGDAEVRRLLSQLSSLAEELNVAMLLVRHLNKKAGISAKYRGGGSIGILAAARSALTVGMDPENPGTNVLAPVKCNLGPTPRSIRFSIVPQTGSSRIAWGERCDVSADELHEPRPRLPIGKLEGAKQILAETLADGPVPETQVTQCFAAAGISESTGKRARRALGVEAKKAGFEEGWVLSLPSPSERDGDEGVQPAFEEDQLPERVS